MDEDRKTAVLGAFISAYALLLDLPETDRVVIQLARAARGMAYMGKSVILAGHGRYGVQVAQGRYRRPLVMEITGDDDAGE